MRVKPGELWRLGDHKLLCGDSTRADHVEHLMGNEKADLIATDPPYMVNYGGPTRPPTKERRNSNKDWTGLYHEIPDEDAQMFVRGFIQHAKRHTKENAVFYIWHADMRKSLIVKALEEQGIHCHQVIVWVKPSPIMGRSFFMMQHEPCLFAYRKGHHPRFEAAHDNPNRYSSVWRIDYGRKKASVGKEHPTQKPIEIFARPMRLHTTIGSLCYEPFSGSGSQIIAGESLKRRVYAIEIEPKFCEVAIKRWESLTGRKAEVVS